MRHGMKPDPMSENRDMPPAVEKKPEAVNVSTPAEDPVKVADTVPTVGASSAPQDISTKPTSQNGYEDNEEDDEAEEGDTDENEDDAMTEAPAPVLPSEQENPDVR